MQLVKHHGLGNDFLVAFPDESWDELPESALAELTVRLCDRRTGVGADGLLIGLDDARADVRMVLFNADGSRAEMSGNGIRCFAHAFAARRGDHSRLRVSTDAGLRTVEMMPTEDPATWLATVDMGEVTEIDEPSGWATLGADPDRPVAHLSLGNPHAVVPVDDVLAVDLADARCQDPARQSRDHRGRPRSECDHDAGARAWRRHHRRPVERERARPQSPRGGGVWRRWPTGNSPSTWTVEVQALDSSPTATPTLRRG